MRKNRSKSLEKHLTIINIQQHACKHLNSPLQSMCSNATTSFFQACLCIIQLVEVEDSREPLFQIALNYSSPNSKAHIRKQIKQAENVSIELYQVFSLDVLDQEPPNYGLPARSRKGLPHCEWAASSYHC